MEEKKPTDNPLENLKKILSAVETPSPASAPEPAPVQAPSPSPSASEPLETQISKTEATADAVLSPVESAVSQMAVAEPIMPASEIFKDTQVTTTATLDFSFDHEAVTRLESLIKEFRRKK